MSGEKPFLSTAENSNEQVSPCELYIQLQKQFQYCENNRDDMEQSTLYLDMPDTTDLATSVKNIHDHFLESLFGNDHHISKSNRVFDMFNYDNNTQVGKLNDGEIPGTFVNIEPFEDAHLLVTMAFSDGKYSTPNNEFLVKQYFIDANGVISVKTS